MHLKEVKRIIIEGAADVFVDHELSQVCETDLAKFCGDVAPGSAQRKQAFIVFIRFNKWRHLFNVRFEMPAGGSEHADKQVYAAMRWGIKEPRRAVEDGTTQPANRGHQWFGLSDQCVRITVLLVCHLDSDYIHCLFAWMRL